MPRYPVEFDSSIGFDVSVYSILCVFGQLRVWWDCMEAVLDSCLCHKFKHLMCWRIKAQSRLYS